MDRRDASMTMQNLTLEQFSETGLSQYTGYQGDFLNQLERFLSHFTDQVIRKMAAFAPPEKILPLGAGLEVFYAITQGALDNADLVAERFRRLGTDYREWVKYHRARRRRILPLAGRLAAVLRSMRKAYGDRTGGSSRLAKAAFEQHALSSYTDGRSLYWIRRTVKYRTGIAVQILMSKVMAFMPEAISMARSGIEEMRREIKKGTARATESAKATVRGLYSLFQTRARTTAMAPVMLPPPVAVPRRPASERAVDYWSGVYGRWLGRVRRGAAFVREQHERAARQRDPLATVAIRRPWHRFRRRSRMPFRAWGYRRQY